MCYFTLVSPCEERSAHRQMAAMIGIHEMKDFMIDIIGVIAAHMEDKFRDAEQRLKKPFRNRTDIYRCEDGRPICFCCLRVGHVAKYCWDRKYSCHHVPPHDPPRPESHAPAPVDVRSSRADLNNLLQQLDSIVKDLKKSQAPFIAKPLGNNQVEVVDGEGTPVDRGTEYPVSTPGVPRTGECHTKLYERPAFAPPVAKYMGRWTNMQSFDIT